MNIRVSCDLPLWFFMDVIIQSTENVGGAISEMIPNCR
jgi:hypothetical protein